MEDLIKFSISNDTKLKILINFNEKNIKYKIKKWLKYINHEMENKCKEEIIEIHSANIDSNNVKDDFEKIKILIFKNGIQQHNKNYLFDEIKYKKFYCYDYIYC